MFGVVFCVSYIIVRMIVGPYFMWALDRHESFYFRSLMTMIMGISFYWGVEIVFKFTRELEEAVKWEFLGKMNILFSKLNKNKKFWNVAGGIMWFSAFLPWILLDFERWV